MITYSMLEWVEIREVQESNYFIYSYTAHFAIRMTFIHSFQIFLKSMFKSTTTQRRSRPQHCYFDGVNMLKHYRQLRVKDLLKVPTWWLEWDLNLRPSGCKTPNLPLSHHAPHLSQWWLFNLLTDSRRMPFLCTPCASMTSRMWVIFQWGTAHQQRNLSLLHLVYPIDATWSRLWTSMPFVSWFYVFAWASRSWLFQFTEHSFPNW